MIERFANKAAVRMLLRAEKRVLALLEENRVLRETNEALWRASDPANRMEEPRGD